MPYRAYPLFITRDDVSQHASYIRSVVFFLGSYIRSVVFFLPCFVTFPVSRALGPRLKGRAEKLCNFIGYNFEFFLVKSNSGWVECKVQEEVDSCHMDEIRRSKCLWWTRENSVRGSSLLCFSIVSSLFSFFNLKHFSATYI